MIEFEKSAIRNGALQKFREVSRGGAFEVYICLWAHSSDNCIVEVKFTDIVRLCGYSRYKTRQILLELEAAGWIERMNPKGRVPLIFALKKILGEERIRYMDHGTAPLPVEKPVKVEVDLNDDGSPPARKPAESMESFLARVQLWREKMRGN